MYIELPDGVYGRDRVHSARWNPAHDLQGLLPKMDLRFVHVVVKDNVASVVTEGDPFGLNAPKSARDELARLQEENRKLKALVESADSDEKKEEAKPEAPSGDVQIPPAWKLKKLTVSELRALALELGVSQKGTGKQLVTRLLKEKSGRDAA